MDDGRLPTSLEEVEALIIELYRPGAPEKVVKIQETLQRLQRGREGWQLADSLLGSKDENIRFFGALTFIVKLNTDAKSLGDDDAHAVLRSLIDWLIRCLRNGEGPLVLRKLCSALVAYFLQFSLSWTRCIKHLLFCLSIDQAAPYQALEEAPETSALIQNISTEKAVAAFWFAASLVEEIGKTDSNSMKQHKFHRLVVPNVDDISPLIARFISDTSLEISTDPKVRQESMRCFQSFVSYSHRAFLDDEIVLDALRALTKPAIRRLVDDDLYEITIELFSDTLSNYSKFLDKEDLKLLHALFNSPWAQERYERLVHGDFDFDSLQFGMFTLAFGDATVQDLAKNIDTDPKCQRFLSALVGLLGAEGYAVNEDKVFVPALEFWNTFVETLINFMYSEEDGKHPSWFPTAETYSMEAIKLCWRKIQFPPALEFSSWDSVDRTGFKDARRDVSDLLQQFELIIGISLLSYFIDLANASIRTGNWAELEASMFCMAQFPDCIANEDQCDYYLGQTFSPSLFALLSRPGTEVPTRTMQSFLTLVDGYPDYFERHTQYLPNALNIVFGATNSPALAKTASRTIVELCSSCRQTLVPELDAFLEQYSKIALLDSIDSHVKEGVTEGIASIVQAIPDDDSKLSPLGQLLSFIEADIDQCLLVMSSHPSVNSNDVADGQSNMYGVPSELGLVPLRCLASIAKGLRVPSDVPVDLEKKATPSPFWTSGNGMAIQQRIFSVINRAYDALASHIDIIEAICSIFRVGNRELEPGPFVFPPETLAQFLLKSDLRTPRLGAIINTACSIVSTNSHTSSYRIDEVLNALLDWIVRLLHALGEPANDVEIAQNGIDFMCRLIPKYLNVLLNYQPPTSLEYLFLFSFKALTGSDPLPKSAAADFWSSFVGLPSLENELQPSIENAIQHLGPLLAQALIYNIGGNAARSELDKLSEPVKKLVVRQAHAKGWLEAALLSDNFPSDNVTVKDKLIFLQKLVNLRGARGTNQVVRDFWLACRGTNFAYAS